MNQSTRKWMILTTLAIAAIAFTGCQQPTPSTPVDVIPATGNEISTQESTPDTVEAKAEDPSKSLFKGWESVRNSVASADPVYGVETLYISTTTLDGVYKGGQDSNVNRLYSLRLEGNGVLQELYSQSYVQDPAYGGADTVFTIIDKKDSKLVLWVTGIDNSPHVCFQHELDATDSIYYLDLEDVEGGLKPYTFPQSRIDEALKRQAECVKINGN